MSHPLKTRRKEMYEKLAQKITDFDYRHTRYKVNYSIAVSYTPESLDMAPLISYIRKTDRYICLDETVHAVVFDCANAEQGIKAANNLLTYFQHANFSKSIYASIIIADDFTNTGQMIAKLFDLLDYAIQHNMDNLIVDSSQIVWNH
ncbi:MAG: hypothetical protein M0P91_01245 [Sulfuricurvum sp.]|jgi:hypothetical protein|uniref:hypothetical protein n=1 Tax=Sulfuricurvum sp. TaxID=2025608 RepID=UPI0025E97BF4|nr:hypothetical protein [Sulfuricurvum sp.]MCK9371794.1 hypothetical protein [Sulfuricurvum sp.]